MTRRLIALLAAIVCCATLAPIVYADAPAAAVPDPAAEALKAKVIKAYAGLTTYASTTHFEMRQKEGGWVMSQAGDFHVALDRKTGKLMYDKPDLRVVDDGTKLLARANQIAQRYLELPAPQTLNFDSLSAQVQFALKPPAVELALLLSNDPIKDINGGAEVTSIKALPPEAGDAQKRPGLESMSSLGKLTLRIDPGTGLVTNAVLELNLAGVAAGDGVSLNYAISPEKADKPLAADRFAFAKEGLTPATSFDAWMGRTPPGADAGAGAGGAGGAAANAGEEGAAAKAHEGKAAPAVALNTLDARAYTLAGDKNDVVILDFWATWCPPCRDWIPHLEKVQAWAKKANKSVAIYAVDESEKSDAVQQYVKDSKVVLPVLMDVEGKVGEAYNVELLPTTVIIAKGKVVHVHIGADPDGEAGIIHQVEEALAAPK